MDYFSFEIDGQKVGYYEEEDDGSVFFCNALMEIEGEKYENPFWVQYDGSRVLGYRYEDGDFIAIDRPGEVYPTSGLNILVRGMKDGETRSFTSLNEGKGEIVGSGTVTRSGHRIQETIEGEARRHVIIDETGAVTEYGWGGPARSQRVTDLAEAKADTPFA